MISVLYIDDEPGLLEVAQLFLEQSGEFDVTTMTSATEGLDSPSIQSYDVIVSDYQMPGMDGIVFLKEVRQRFGNLPFILFTGRGREEVVIDAINNGVDFYLQKGGDPTAQFAELAHKIRQAVGRRRAEEALNESERRFRELADLLPQGIYEADTNGRLSYVNRHALEMFRYTGEDIRNGINIFDTIASVNREQAARAFHLVAEEGAKPKISTEYQALRKDGSTFPVAIFSSPILHNGRLTGVRGILMDITDIKRAEEELIRKNQELNVSYENVAAAEEELRAHVEKLTLQERALEESESRLRSFIETTRESVALIDEQGKVIEWNFGSERISGIKKEDALGSYVWDLTFDMLPRENRMEERRAAIEHTIRTMIETGIPAFEEPRVIEAVRPDGSRIYTRQFIFPIKTDKGFGLGSIAQDITREKLVEDAIRESEEKYRLLANVTNDVIYTVDLQGTVTYISPRISRYGYTTEEIISRNFSGFIAEEDMPAVVTEFEKTIVTGMPSVIQLRLRDKAGNLHWMEDNGAPVVNASGSVVAITGILRDITERKKAEESVRKSFAILKGVVESPKDVVIFALDRQYRYTAFNENHRRTMKQIWGADIILGNSMVGYIRLPEDRKKAIINFNRALAGESFTVIEAYGDTAFERRWYEDIYNPVTDENGNVIGLTLFLTDITERQQAEEALCDSEQKFREIFNNINDAIELHEVMDDGHPGKYLEVNNVTCRMLGYTREELVQHSPLEFTIGYNGRRIEDINREILAKGHSQFEAGRRNRNGEIIPVEINAHVIVLHGRTMMLSVVRDITERKQAVEALRQANSKLNLLSSITRHDINNQLFSLKAYLELSKLSLGDAAKMSEYIIREERAANAIQRQILFTKEYEDMGVKTSIWHDVDACVRKVQASLPMRDIRVIIDSPDIEVYADPLFEKVFYNLIDNALRYGGPDMTRIRVSAQESEKGLVISVEDDGTGISVVGKKRLFERGFGRNTGLGLFLSREVLSITGIMIAETSEPGKGARFEITVPKGEYRFSGDR